jgi:hypothetical protein
MASVDLPPTSRRPATFPSYATHETPSVAPVAMSTSLGLAARGAADRTIQLRRLPRSSVGTMSVAVLLAAAFAGIAVAIVIFVPNVFARSGAPALVGRLKGTTHKTPPSMAAPPPVVTALPVAPPPVAPPTVSVDTLPKADVGPDMTLVTLPASAKGHRVFVDGRVVTNGKDPLEIKCGKHKIQIGSSGKPRVTELPCGGELTID